MANDQQPKPAGVGKTCQDCRWFNHDGYCELTTFAVPPEDVIPEKGCLVFQCGLGNFEQKITCEMIKQLRESIGYGTAMCKRYLKLAEGDMEIAKELVKYDGYAVMCYDRDGNRMSYVEAAAKRLLAEKKEER